MATDYYTGGYGGQYNSGAGYYPVQQQPFGNQNFNMNANYAPNSYPTQAVQQSFYREPYGMNQGYTNNPNYPPNYGMNFAHNQVAPFPQQPQVTQQNKLQSIQGPTSVAQRKNNEKLPLEIRGGVVISNCHCSKKNGLQDHCGRSVCRVENESKRRRQRIWHDPPTKDTELIVPNSEANNIILNPAYNDMMDYQVVPSNAEPVPVAYNYIM